MSLSSRYIYAISFAIAATGFLVPLWPLCVVGILIAALSGRYFFALLMGVLIDLGFGPPAGWLYYIYMPFTALAAACALARFVGASQFLDKTPPDTL